MEQFAMEILFTGKVDAAKHGLEYRKGKTLADVVKARTRALKNGRAKTEHEIGMMALYLKDVFKKAKP